MTKGTPAWKTFPPTRRALLERIAKLEPFWARVRHTYRIDMTAFSAKLGSGIKDLDFHFIDPLWGWLMAALRQHPLDMHWKPSAQSRDDAYYGGGVQWGECMRAAAQSCPQGGYPMLIGLHWDGTGSRKLSCSPICVAVGNTNSCDSSTQYCVGYMPHVPDEKSKEFNRTPLATTVKYYIRQQCATAIFRVLEAASVAGVRCRLPNGQGVEVERLLFPKLVSMNFDQPEAQLFFGLQNKQCCSKCRWRKGYSAFRKGTPQCGCLIRRLYRLANDSRSPHMKLARDKLQRWGFNWQRRCPVLDVSDHLLVHLPGQDEVFPCLDYRDRMHAAVIFHHRLLFETLNDIKLTYAQRRLLDQRLACVCAQRGLRGPDGKSYRVQKTVFNETGMTASDRICLIFFLPHVLGPSADVFPEAIRYPLLTVVSHMQVLLIAVHGQRSFSEYELGLIFDRGLLVMFAALETIHNYNYNLRVAASANDPDAPAPKRFKRQSR